MGKKLAEYTLKSIDNFTYNSKKRLEMNDVM